MNFDEILDLTADVFAFYNTHTDRHTDRQTNSIMAPCTHPGMKRLFCLKAKNGLIMKRFFCPNGLITSREVKEARRPHTCSRPCAFEEKTKRTKKNPAAAKTHHATHSSPATATTSRQRATKHVPCVSPYSLASIDPGFVEIGLVQLSQSEKTTNVTHTYAQSDRLTK